MPRKMTALQKKYFAKGHPALRKGKKGDKEGTKADRKEDKRKGGKRKAERKGY